MNLTHRSTLAEVMDDPSLDPAIYARCIGDLAKLNRVTFTHRPVLHWLAQTTRALPQGSTVSLLDVAYGDGDLLRAIGRWAAKRGFVARLSGIDLNPRSAAAAQAATPADLTIDYHCGDVFDYVPEQKPDFIVTSQFTHHLDDAQLVAFLRWIDRVAVRGWFITDLHRHAVPYYGFRVLARLMGWHRIVASDGTISIARGFRRDDWVAALAKAGVGADVAWRFPFRHSVSRRA
ncbi:MAG: methyltransferase domain-containing protein [Acidiphilium sp.]|nr:methyltransferase domain-containing protein [Acidiphilium sp.]MDD4936682.1 methyltransferase domain-containing protein [Acidiphilium sp.]